MPASNTAPKHPGLTIAVYKVDAAGARYGRQITTAQRPSEAPPMNSSYPPCDCAHCRGQS